LGSVEHVEHVERVEHGIILTYWNYWIILDHSSLKKMILTLGSEDGNSQPCFVVRSHEARQRWKVIKTPSAGRPSEGSGPHGLEKQVDGGGESKSLQITFGHPFSIDSRWN
jgi:hypothetical protein